MQLIERGVLLLIMAGGLLYANDEELKHFRKAVSDSNLTYVAEHINDKDIVANLKKHDDSIANAVSGLKYTDYSKKEHDDREKIAMLLIEHGANKYYIDHSSTLLAIAIKENYVNLTKYLFEHSDLKKHYALSDTDSFFDLIRSKKMLDFFTEKGLADSTDIKSSRTTPLHLILKEGLFYDNGLDCKNLGDLKQFLSVKDVYHNRPIDGYISYISRDEERACFDDLVSQMEFDPNKNDTLLLEMKPRGFSLSSYKNLIKKGINLNAINYGETILTQAIKAKNKELIEVLLEQKEKIDINQTDNEGSSLLMNSIVNNDKKLAVFFIEKGVDINLLNEVGETALSLAKEKDMPELVEILEKKNAKILTKEERVKRYYTKEYIDALNYKNIDVIKNLIYTKKVSINTMVNGDESPLSLFINTDGAGDNKRLAIINFLIDEGIDLNLGKSTAESLLASAFEHSRIEIARKLISRGAKLDDDVVMSAFPYLDDQEFIFELLKKNPKLLMGSNMFGETLLTSLSRDGEKNLKFFNQLLEYIDMESENKDGTYNNLFRLVEEHGDNEGIEPFVKSLLAHGYSTSTRLSNGKTVLMVALESAANLEVVKLLMGYNRSESFFDKLFGEDPKLDLTVKSKDGRGLAHFIALAQKDVLEFMIKKGVKVGVHGGSDDSTPLMIAIKKNRNENIALLLDKKTINHEDKYGKTALNYVQEYDYGYMLKPLKDMGAVANTKKHIEQKSTAYELAKKEPKGLEKILKSGDKKALLKAYKEVKKDELDDFISDVLLYGDLESFKVLVDNGMRLDMIDSYGYSLLASAVYFDNMEVVKFLISKKSDINKKSKGELSLFKVSAHSSVAMIKFLIKEGMEMAEERENIVGKALAYNKKEIAEYLLKEGFPLDKKNLTDDYIRHYISKGKTETIEFLLSHGCHNIQGYFYSKPIDTKNMTKYLNG